MTRVQPAKGYTLPPDSLYVFDGSAILHHMAQSTSTTSDADSGLGGTWQSSYTYTSSSRPGETLTGEHTVRLQQNGKQLVLESLPSDNSSYLFVRLSLNDDNVATGSWEEATDPNGRYGGATYYGAIQLTLAPDRRSMRGQWVGFGKDREVNTGPWEFTRLD